MGLCYQLDQGRARDAQRRQAIADRVKNGFVWDGGAVGGNDNYCLPPFRYDGLRSSQHPILQLFVSKVPSGRRLLVGDDKAIVGPAPFRSKLKGLDAPYVVANEAVRGVMPVEIDRNLTWLEVELACQIAKVPLPNIAVGFQDAEGTVLHPHLLWLLRDGVAWTECCGRRGLLNAVLGDMTAALAPHGADAGGLSNAMRVKNPLSPLWSQRVVAEVPFDLIDLRQRVPTFDRRRPDISDREVAALTRDHSDPLIAIQSNGTFSRLAAWAREAIHQARAEGKNETAWLEMVEQKALTSAKAMLGNQDSGEVEQQTMRLAVKVARWTWKNVAPKPSRLTAAEIKARQVSSGRRTAESRAATSEAAIAAAARQFAGDGQSLTTNAILRIVRRACHRCSRRTIQRRLRAAEVAPATPPHSAGRRFIVAEMRAGLSWGVIADKLWISKTQARRLFRQKNEGAGG